MKFVVPFLALAALASGQDEMKMTDMNGAGMSLMRIASGTSVNPASWDMPMWMTPLGSWNLMLMALGYAVDTQQSGPRGGDKLYSPNWFMASAAHRAGAKGAFQADVMLSLEPATIANERYPLLFQTGETAYGRPLEDAQHPHNFVMSLGVHYAYEASENTTLDIYAAPVGDPALGPVAFPHRASADDLPEATITHHLMDSTHISDDVVTVGITHKQVRLEASGFHGAEPGENRWIIQAGPMDSWSARVWYFPSKNWAAQVSVGRIGHPEALEPGDQVRSTASVSYSRPMAGSSWSSTLAWGRNHNTVSQHDTDGYLAETVVPVSRRNFLTGRIEFADKDELFYGQPGLDQMIFRVGEYTAGYRRDLALFSHIETGVGANFSFYTLPDAIKPYYGNRPVGGNLYLRFGIRRNP